MLQLNDLHKRMARLELRCPPAVTGRGSSEATEVRSMLFGMLQNLVALKEEREQLEVFLDLDEAA